MTIKKEESEKGETSNEEKNLFTATATAATATTSKATLATTATTESPSYEPLYIVFDMLYYNGQVLTNKALSERRSLLQEVLKPLPHRLLLSQAALKHTKSLCFLFVRLFVCLFVHFLVCFIVPCSSFFS